MCSNVFMGNTKHITVRMPESLVEVIDGRAEREKRSRSQVVVLGLQSEFGVSAEGVKSGSGELETQQAAVVDRLSASRPTLKVSNPSSPTKIYVEGVKGERDAIGDQAKNVHVDSRSGSVGNSPKRRIPVVAGRKVGRNRSVGEHSPVARTSEAKGRVVDESAGNGHKCPVCGSAEVKPWGPGQMRCGGCSRNFAE